MHELLEYLERLKIPRGGKEAQYYETTRNRLRSCVGVLGEMFDCSEGYLGPDLLEENLIFDCRSLSTSPDHLSFVVNLFLAWLYYHGLYNPANSRS